MAAYQHESAALFVEMTGLAADLAAVEHRLTESRSTQAFVGAFQHARQTRTVAEPETWRHLRSLEVAARLDLSVRREAWRATAREIAERGLERARDQASRLGLARALVEPLEAPMASLLAEIAEASATARLAALPELATLAADRLERALFALASPVPDPDADPKPRARQTVRVGELLTGVLIGSETAWDLARAKLDAEVRRLLAGGYDVEIR